MQGLTGEMHRPPASTITPKRTMHGTNPACPGKMVLSHYWGFYSFLQCSWTSLG